MRRNYTGGNVLDVGAGKNKMLLSVLSEKLNNGRYYSLDTDPTGDFDFDSYEDIPDNLSFSLICANQVFEHLELQESIDMMYITSKYLEDNGKFIITIPNISHPNRYFGDITHQTPWSYPGFYMIYKYANLDVVKIARYSKRHPKGLMEKIITRYVSRVYRMDWCDSILMIGIKNS
ncbi:MAG: methyltransferase domain-containing protein [Candidatus Thorarchaeota archaeon]